MQPLLAFALVAAQAELPALARYVGHHQPAAMKHAQELLQLVESDFLGRKIVFEPFLDFVHADRAVEHLQDGEFFFLKTEVLQTHGIFHHPVGSTQVVLPCATRSGRLRMASARAELDTKLSWRVTIGEMQNVE